MEVRKMGIVPTAHHMGYIVPVSDDEVVTHHWITERDGKWAGEPAFRLVCQFCRISFDGGKHSGQPCPQAPK